MAPRRADSPSKISAAAAAARRTFRVGGGGVTILPAAAAQRDRLRALVPAKFRYPASEQD